ncbi:MAG TPA: hypothetical protein VMV81_01945, partial [Phycisphaerae bacterium]|nr:hypothetical protein [Phycisphaerae bacterium]
MKSSHNWLVGLAAAAALTLGASARTVYANGACCKTDGTCSDVANTGACSTLGGFYLGDGTTCASSDCSRGACVRADVSGNPGCSVTSQYECNLKEGSWAGAGTTCNGVLANGYYTTPINGGQVNVSGSSALQSFMEALAATNDFSNSNGNDVYCRSPLPNGPVTDTGNPFAGFVDTDCDGFIDAVEQLAPTFTCPGSAPTMWGHWLLNYRSVGSIEGFVEFIDWQLPPHLFHYNVPNPGEINRVKYANGGVIQPGCIVADCNAGGGTTNDDGTPICRNSVDVALTDVPGVYGVEGSGAVSDAQFDKKPGQVGYGHNTTQTYANNGQFQIPELASLTRGANSLNTNLASPDADTIYDTNIAWVPFCIGANRGTGVQNLRITDLQHLWVTGRMPNGENLVAGTRDVGSGTRNGTMNSIGIDPSWGRGDGFGPRTDITADSNVGLSITANSPIFSKRCQPNGGGASGVMRNAMLNWRLCLGYNGLASSGGDANSGNYEVINLCHDIDANGTSIPGFSCTANACNGGGGCGGGNDVAPSNNGYVRPGLNTVLDNLNPLCGWQMGGLETMITRGDPLEGPGNPTMSNLAARDYVRNISNSVTATTDAPNGIGNNAMPGQQIAISFFLPRAIDALPGLNPSNFTATAGFSQDAQDYSRCNSTLAVPAFGTKNTAGKVPIRNSLSGQTSPPFLYAVYSDGSVNGAYDNGTGTLSLNSGTVLNQRNRIGGDFNYDLARNVRDIPEMMKALKNPRKYENDEYTSSPTGVTPLADPLNPTGGAVGGCVRNFAIPEILGDFNGDGNFDAEDIRYFADGLAIDPATGKLNRCLGWNLVDQWWLYYKVGPGSSYPSAGRPEYAGVKPPWAPTLPSYMPAWPDPRVIGAAVADIAGNTPSPGWEPTGQDGVVDARDIDYVYANFGDFTNLRYSAVHVDLSADMNGDLRVDQLDVDKIVRDVLCTHYGDRNLDGIVDASDDPSANLGLSPA